MTLVLSKRMWPHSADFRFKNVFVRRIRQKSALHCCILLESTEVMYTPRSDFPQNFNNENIHQIRTGKYNASSRCLLPATLLEQWWAQVCRVKITFELLLNNWFVSTNTNLMKCFVNWIPANSHVCSNKNQPYIKVGLGISRTNADSQWNPVYNAFHRIFCFGNETICG